MLAPRRLTVLSIALLACGCSSTGGQLGTLQTQNRSLLEQNKAQLAEMENLKTHNRRLEDKLLDAQARLAAQQRDDDDRRMAAKQGESSSVFDRSGKMDDDDERSAATGHDDLR